MASGPITSWQIDGETMERVTDFFGGGLFNLYAEYIMRNAGLDEAQLNQDCQEKYQ